MIKERTQAKYMTVLEDMYKSSRFSCTGMSKKHGIGYDLFTATKELGYITKIDSTAKYKWAVNRPTRRHLNRVTMVLNTRRAPKKKKTIVKLLWGLITYEK
jgi:hypothetical protein